MNDKFESGYCPACGKSVKVFGLLVEGDFVYRCMQCGMEVEVQKSDAAKPVPEQPRPAEENAAPKEKASPKQKSLKYVMIAEDSKLLLQLLNDLLLQEGYAETVSASLDGDQFLQKFTESMILKNPPNLIILDINLPAIDGINICVAIRAIEKAFGNKKCRPIIFFTAREIDNHLKRIIDTYPPARYINKGVESDPEKMAERIKKVMEALLR